MLRPLLLCLLMGLLTCLVIGAPAVGAAIDPAPLRAVAEGARVRIDAVALAPGRTVALDLERVRVTRPDTRFVLGRRGGADVEADYDPGRVVHLRGRVAGEPGSDAFISVSPRGPVGWIETGGERYLVDPGGALRRAAELSVFGAGPPCALVEAAPPGRPGAAPRALAGRGGSVQEDVRLIELAIETDHEFFLLHGDPAAALDYVGQLFAAVSAIYQRDVRARFVLTFVRIWEDPDDLFNEPNPLGPFAAWWNENMGGVPRDVAQLVSGRRNLPYGGSAFLSGVCAANGYSVVGYVLGFAGEAAPAPGIFNFDVAVSAHELGHSCGAQHTHNYGIDTCNDLDGVPQRGTIMSYCAQTVSGGNANTDLRFHAEVQGHIEAFLESINCLDFDCNGNGIADSLDLALGGSTDLNGNGRPDECEDCNGNGVFDKADVLTGSSPDVNGNIVPDECEPDCNSNGLPDDHDIAEGTSIDLYGNGVPDECESDLDGNGVSDYTQIQADLGLDLDRNAILDAFEDCDGDGIPDLDALAGAHDAWVASLDQDDLREFNALTGTRVRVAEAGHVSLGHDVVIDGAGRILVTSGADHRVAEFDRGGAFAGDFVPAGAGGLAAPGGLAFGPNGNLFVVSTATDSVLEFHGVSGAPGGAFVASGSGGLDQPFGLAFAPGGNLLVTDGAAGAVREYHGKTGAFVGNFVAPADNGGLAEPRGLAFKPDGNLLVASSATNEVLEYDGSTGAFLRKFNQGGTATALTLDRPWGIRIGPDGRVYVSRSGVEDAAPPGGAFLPDPLLHINSSRIYCFDPASGNFLRSYVTGNDTGLYEPTGFDFYPGAALDCNHNNRPDSCDIAQGTSLDLDGDGIPDECPPPCPGDLDGDGVTGFADLTALLNGWGPCAAPCPTDFDGNGAIGFADLNVVLGGWGPCR